MARLIPEINPKINLRDLVGLILVMMPSGAIKKDLMVENGRNSNSEENVIFREKGSSLRPISATNTEKSQTSGPPPVKNVVSTPKRRSRAVAKCTDRHPDPPKKFGRKGFLKPRGQSLASTGKQRLLMDYFSAANNSANEEPGLSDGSL